TLLLQAALLDGSLALPAWKKWQQGNDLDCIEAGDFRLLGLLYRNLAKAGLGQQDQYLPRLKGIYRNFWTKNQLVLGRKTALIGALHEKQIPCMILKGAALTHTVYRDHGVRPMEDLDLMVPRHRLEEVMDLMEGMGWVSEYFNSRLIPRTVHACNFKDPTGANVDLHWRLGHTVSPPGFDESIWEQAIPVDMGRVPCLAPSYTDQLIHACEHGPRHNAITPIRWIADTFWILRAAGGLIDWERVASISSGFGCVPAVRDTLRYLEKNLAVKVPVEAWQHLQRAKITLQDRVEYFLVRQPVPTLWHKIPLDLSWHIRKTRGLPLGDRLGSFHQHFRDTNNLLPGQFTRHYRAKLRYWFRYWLPWHLRRVPRWILPREPGTVSAMPPEAFQNFYALEPYGHRTFRWSQPVGGLWIHLPAGRHFKVMIDTGKLREWTSDLARHLRFTLDGVSIPSAQLKGKQGVLTLSITLPEDCPDTPSTQVLAWTCEPFANPTDTRPLGLSVFSVNLRPIKPKRTVELPPEPESRQG
ncbi:MAG: nucleotidyltransferase family protein, partial [Verrucomicrobium sp.]